MLAGNNVNSLARKQKENAKLLASNSRKLFFLKQKTFLFLRDCQESFPMHGKFSSVPPPTPLSIFFSLFLFVNFCELFLKQEKLKTESRANTEQLFEIKVFPLLFHLTPTVRKTFPTVSLAAL